MSHTAPVRPARRLAVACGAVVLLLAASACGNADDKDATPRTSQPDGGSQDQQGGPTANGRMPGANGKVAAVDGSTAQVQGMEGQVAVTWNGSTTFTKEVSATLADVKVGSCVLVAPSGEPSSSATTPATEVVAASVRISAKTDGSCAAGVRAPGGPGGPAGPAGGDGGQQLDGAPPSDAPDGARPQVRTLGGAVGEVTAVSSTGFTVDSVLPGSEDKTAVTVTVGADTSYTTNVAGKASDVKVGVCVAASGQTDDTGAVTATTVAVSQPVDGACGGLVRFRSGDGAPSTRES
jgi:hypothetical protein